MRFLPILYGTIAVLTVASSAAAQDRTERERIARERAEAARARVRAPAPRVFFRAGGDESRTRIGVGTASGGERDTLGLLITSVTPGGPADKAGLAEGNRIVAVNGTSLTLSRDDAGEPDMRGLTTRRLVRELQKVEPGQEVELRVYDDGRIRTVRVKTVDVEDLQGNRVTRQNQEERAVVGLGLQATGSVRDTLGALITTIAENGPAEKAGLVEGDRVAAVNGVSIAVSRDDAGDDQVASAKVSRFTRELRKVTAGQTVELRVYSGGQFRTVRITTARASDVYPNESRGGMFWFGGPGEGGMMTPSIAPMPPIPPMPPMPARIRAGTIMNGRTISDFEHEIDMDHDFDMDHDVQEGSGVGRGFGQGMGRSIGGRDVEEVARGAAEVQASREEAGATAPRLAGDAVSELEARVRAAELDAREARTQLERERSGRDAEVRRRLNAGIAPMRAASSAVAPRTWVWGNGSRASSNGGVRTYTGRGEQYTLDVDGLRLTNINADLAAYLGAGSERGLLVVGADERWSGVRTGDVVLSIDGRAVRADNEARVTLLDETSHRLEVIRRGQRAEVVVGR